GIDEFITKIQMFLEKNLLIVKMIGSKVTGNFQPDSDIDLFILVKECNYSVMHAISEVSAEINLNYDIIISPIIYSVEEHNKNVYFKTLFIRELDKNGVSIYEAV
ncbi:MAG: nucleotidyltransferase domain-containing protein, partial [Armatimonadetes bacterium]|nr:nucleotidyltransferase domain-containing protein [Armatimonadota bacterium]